MYWNTIFDMKTEATRINNKRKPASKSNKGTRVLVSLAIIALTVIGISCYFYIQEQFEFQAEQTAYEKLQDCIYPAPYEHFLKSYPQSIYHEDVCERLKEVRQMNHEWNTICKLNKRTAYTEFMKKHPDSPFYPACLAKLDSIDWSEASRHNSISSYNIYLAAHPQGAYADDARNNREQLQKLTVTPAELSIIRGLLNNYFSALSTQDESALRSTLAFIINDYWHKNKVSQDYAVIHMKHLYEKSGIQDINFTVNNKLTVKKQQTAEFRYAFDIQFTVDAIIKRTGHNKPKHTRYIVVAHISPDHKIDGLVLKKQNKDDDGLLTATHTDVADTKHR